MAQDINLSAEERAFLEAHPVIRVHNEQDWRPFNYIENGEARGYTIALFALLAERLGLEVEYVQGREWSHLLRMLEDRELDVICNMVRTEERERYTAFSDPILELKTVIISRKDEPVADLAELEGRTIAVVREHWYQYLLENLYPGISIHFTETSLDAIRLVAEGVVDAAANYDLTAEYFFRSYGYDHLGVTGTIEGLNPGWDALHLGIRKDWPLMVSAFNKAIASLSFRNEIQLWDRWVYKVGSQELFSVEERAYLERIGAIRYTVDPNWLPIEGVDQDGRHVGQSADILDLLAERTGLSFELVPTRSWDESYDLLLSGGCDLISLAMKTPDHDKVLDFARPILKQVVVIATDRDVPYIPDFDLLEGKTLAVIRKYGFVELLKRSHPEVDVLEVEDVAEGFDAVLRGEAFGYLDVLTPIIYQIQRRGLQDLKVNGQFPEFPWTQSIAVREGNDILLGIVNKALGTLSDTEKNREYETWYSIAVETGTDYSLLWKTVGIFAAVLTLVLLWNRSLSRSRKAAREALEELGRAQSQLEEIARTDKMTGLKNRACLDELLDAEIARAQRYSTELALVICDLDKFKEVNDTLGHAEGDRLISHFASIVKKGSRSSDTVGRWGGEEFLLICPMTDGPSAFSHAESLRRSFYETPLDGVGIRSASFGAASFRDGDTARELLIRADKALYKAKEKGRNRVELDP